MLRKQIIIIIAGPTALGKTCLGIQVALKLGGEIISADSRQIYRYMDIGTAKPEPGDLERVKHYFIDIKNPDEYYSAGRFGREVRACIKQLGERGIPPILVGGSGLYLQAVLDGFFEDETDYSEIRAHFKQRLERQGLAVLYQELGRCDPQAQTRISPRDSQRILRALEIAHARGEVQHARWAKGAEAALDCSPLGFCLEMNRESLYQRIDHRVDAMLEKGLLGEVESLVAMGYGRGSYAMETFGYQEVLDYLEGKLSLDDAIATIKCRSRHYAKRQLTWFRRDRRLRWMDLDAWGIQGVQERIATQYRSREP